MEPHTKSEFREQLLGANIALDDSTARLNAAHKAAQEAEHVSIQVFEQLRQQREQLHRATVALDETDANMSHSSRILRDMVHR